MFKTFTLQVLILAFSVFTFSACSSKSTKADAPVSTAESRSCADGKCNANCAEAGCGCTCADGKCNGNCAEAGCGCDCSGAKTCDANCTKEGCKSCAGGSCNGKCAEVGCGCTCADGKCNGNCAEAGCGCDCSGAKKCSDANCTKEGCEGCAKKGEPSVSSESAASMLPNDGTRVVGDVTKCPVSQNAFTVAADSPKVELEGKTFYLCCAGCVDKFKADPAKFL